LKQGVEVWERENRLAPWPVKLKGHKALDLKPNCLVHHGLNLNLFAPCGHETATSSSPCTSKTRPPDSQPASQPASQHARPPAVVVVVVAAAAAAAPPSSSSSLLSLLNVVVS